MVCVIAARQKSSDWWSRDARLTPLRAAPRGLSGLFARAKAHRDANMQRIDTRAEFEAFFGAKNEAEDAGGAVKGGFALVHYSPDPKLEDELKAKFAGQMDMGKAGGIVKALLG